MTKITISIATIIIGAHLLNTQLARGAETYGPYRAEIVRIIDGDTVIADVHTWPATTVTIGVRINGIDTPEHRGKPCEREAAQRATEYISTLIPPGTEVQLHNVTPGKYAGRIVADVHREHDDIAAHMLASGHAKAYTGGERLPWCGY